MPSDELELDLDLGPLSPFRALPPILADLGGDAKTVKMERATKADHDDHLRTSADRVRQVVAERLDSARPRRERAEQEIERVLEAERENYEQKWGRRVEWLQQRAKKARDELPDLGGEHG